MLDHLLASFVCVLVRLLERVRNRGQMSIFGNGMDATTLFPMLLQLVPQGVRLFLGMILLVSEPFPAILVPLVRVLHVCRRVLILVILQRAVLRRYGIMCIKVEICAVRGESYDLGVAGGSGCPR